MNCHQRFKKKMFSVQCKMIFGFLLFKVPMKPEIQYSPRSSCFCRSSLGIRDGDILVGAEEENLCYYRLYFLRFKDAQRLKLVNRHGSSGLVLVYHRS